MKKDATRALKRQQGFSVLPLIVALVVVGVISTGVYVLRQRSQPVRTAQPLNADAASTASTAQPFTLQASRLPSGWKANGTEASFVELQDSVAACKIVALSSAALDYDPNTGKETPHAGESVGFNEYMRDGLKDGGATVTALADYERQVSTTTGTKTYAFRETRAEFGSQADSYSLSDIDLKIDGTRYGLQITCPNTNQLHNADVSQALQAIQLKYD